MAGINIWGFLGATLLVVGTGAFIMYQNTQIEGLKSEKVLLLEKMQKLEAAIALDTKERIRLAAELKDYQNRKAEIEVKYITKPVTVFREVVKTTPPEIVSTKANEETNAIFDSINSRAVTFSLRNDPN